MHIKQHADRDKKQAEQHIAERLDVFFHLVLVFGFRNQHAGHESTQRQRQTGAIGDPCRAERDQEQVEHEQLLRTAFDHDPKPATDQFLSDHQQQHQHENRF